MRAVILANGGRDEPETIKRWLKDSDRILCADGGARLCLALGLAPEFVVGDFDSLTPEEVERCQALGATLERHSPDKDATDLELAVAKAAALGADHALILGAWGDEPDHVLGNVLLLCSETPGLHLAMAQGGMLFQVLRPGATLELHGPAGGVASALALSGRVTGLTYTGLEYGLTNATLARGSGLALRNRILSSPATVRIESGLLLVMHQALA